MYERSAIVLDRYFEKLFGYNLEPNLKDNYAEYCKLVECFEKYTQATESEDKIMQEYEEVATRIKNIQKNQESLYKRSIKLQEERNIIFQNIGEDAKYIKENFDKLDKIIEEINGRIKENEREFIGVIANFTQKSEVRNDLGKTRKNVEKEYSTILSESQKFYKSINQEKIQVAKNFDVENKENAEKELNEKLKKNGEKEKIPFDLNVIKRAVKCEVNIQSNEVEILYNIYEKTNKLFLEIKNNNVKIERHKKLMKDAKSKLSFISALKEYLVQFLDNERLTAVNGEAEHKKQMKEACKNLEEDLVQINNMYELLLKEASGKANKKMYKELYDIEYLKKLEEDAKKFDEKISKLNLFGTVINPNHWRIDGMEKIYKVFYNNVVELYGRNLSEFKLDEADNEDDSKSTGNDKIEIKDIKDIKDEDEEYSYEKEEIDEKVDMILGLDKQDDALAEQKDDWEEDSDFTDEEDDWEEDSDFTDEEDDWEEDSDFTDEEDDWEEDSDFTDEEDDWEEDSDFADEEDDWEEDSDFADEEDDWEEDGDFADEEDDWEEDSIFEKDSDFDDEKDYILRSDDENRKLNKTMNNSSKGDYESKSKLIKKRGKHILEDSEDANIITKIKKISKSNKKEDKSKGLLGKFIK